METIVYFDAIRAISKCHNRKIAVAFHVKICYADVFVLVFSVFSWFGRKGFLNEALSQTHVLARIVISCHDIIISCHDTIISWPRSVCAARRRSRQVSEARAAAAE